MLEKRKLVDTFVNLVTIDSESGHEKEIADQVAERLRALGCDVTIDDAGAAFGGEVGNVIARLPGVGTGDAFFTRPFLLNAHLDTVSPGKEVRPKIRDDVVSASTPTILGADDKAGVAVILHVLETLVADGLPHPPLEVVFTVSEEVGLAGSRHLDYGKLAAKEGLSLDASQVGSFVVSAPFKVQLEVEVSGLASHAADPAMGINAIQVAAQAVSKMRLGLVDDETTCNIGTFSASGPINIVPDRATLQIEVRSRSEAKLKGQIDHINRCLREGGASFVARRPDGERRPGVSATTKRVYDGYAIDREDRLVKRAVEAAEALDITPLITDGMGGTDANNFASKGIKVLNMGVGIHEAHTTREWISTYDLFKAARLLLRIVSGR